MTTVYVAGPMTGIEDFNYPTFNAAADSLRAAGYEVLNPTLDRKSPAEDPPGMTWVDYMRAAIIMVAKADGIALLPGWTSSRGATLEVEIAQRLELPVGRVEDWLSGLMSR